MKKEFFENLNVGEFNVFFIKCKLFFHFFKTMLCINNFYKKKNNSQLIKISIKKTNKILKNNLFLAVSLMYLKFLLYKNNHFYNFDHIY